VEEISCFGCTGVDFGREERLKAVTGRRDEQGGSRLTLGLRGGGFPRTHNMRSRSKRARSGSPGNGRGVALEGALKVAGVGIRVIDEGDECAKAEK
jgi:hypothetical protein